MELIPRQLPSQADIAGIATEYVRMGSGRPLLFLHGGDGLNPDAAFLKALSRRFEVTAASHPGFGASALPAGFASVDDLRFFYLDLLETLDLDDVVVVGVSFGAWLAAELAVCASPRIAGLVLAGAVGVKFADRETREILDVFSMTMEDYIDVLFHDRARGRAAFADAKFADIDGDSLMRIARNREAFMRFGWSPTLYNPRLRSRLHRIKVPTLVLWGEHDRVVPPQYGRKLAAGIGGARFELIPDAGHYAYAEAPAAFAAAVERFGAADPKARN